MVLSHASPETSWVAPSRKSGPSVDVATVPCLAPQPCGRSLPPVTTRLALAAAALLLPLVSQAQWVNRYPLHTGLPFHVYFEGYELPTTAAGPLDVAPSPDGSQLALAARGWLWLLDVKTGVARRVTSGAGSDSRPAWSPDGRSLVFVRDDSRTLSVVLLDLASGRERELDRGLAMDPVFSRGGASIIYSAGAEGRDVDLQRLTLASGAIERLTSDTGLELRPQVLPGDRGFVYVSKSRAKADRVVVRPSNSDQEMTLVQGNILSGLRPALSPDGRRIAYSWPASAGWELRLLSLADPKAITVLVARPRGRPITPSWSADGSTIYYSEADRTQHFRLWRVPAIGGSPTEVVIKHWDFGTPAATLVVDTRGPARLAVTSSTGHPLVPDSAMTHFDGQNGIVFAHSPGRMTYTAPAGEVRVMAVRGLATPPVERRLTLAPGRTTRATLALAPVWDARANGWFAGDHHFHLNYGGQVDLQPGDLRTSLLAEDLDVATPMLANLAERNDDQSFWSWRSPAGERPMVRFAQEVRSHFLGHVGLLGTRELFWPWGWGPGYATYPDDDRPNADALATARAAGGLGISVHPVDIADPFASDDALDALPLTLVPDAVLGAVDLLEIVGLWNNSVGTSDVWYRLLNAGLPVMPVAGTDVMTDLFRTMAVGTARVYAHPRGPLSWTSWYAALREGRSFVTSGPMIELSAEGALPGGITRGGRTVRLGLGVHSASRVDTIAVVVNGRTVSTIPPPTAPFSRRFTMNVTLPDSGWLAVRVVGPAIDTWPGMADRTFAHTAPVWIGARGSSVPAQRRAAAADLLRALDRADQRLSRGYGEASIPALRAQFAAARARLAVLSR